MAKSSPWAIALPARRRHVFAHSVGGVIESLEARRLLSNVLSNHNDAGSTGEDLNETILTPADVASTEASSSISTNFGRKFDTALDGQVYAQPLAVSDVNITRGSLQGVHNVLYVATMHDSLYAVDANSGAILWQDNFTQIANPQVTSIGSPNSTAGVTTIPAKSGDDALVNSADVGPELGILATPAIDGNTNILFVVADTQELRNGTTPANTFTSGTTDIHYVQRLWAININDGSVAITPSTNPPTSSEPTSAGQMVGDTILDPTGSNTVPSFSGYTGYEYVAGPFIKGNGDNGTDDSAPRDGWITSPYESATPWGQAGETPMAAQYVVFNALLQMNRVATTIINGQVYLGFASHGDDGPYYGWLLGYNELTLANDVAFISAPTYESFNVVSGDRSDFDSQAGFWNAGSTITTDGTYLYISTGNGAFNPNTDNFSSTFTSADDGNTVQLPLDSDYGDAVLKLQLDLNANQSNIDPPNGIISNPNGTYDPDGGYNANGYGLKVVDFFTPSNVFEMNANDEDLGSGGVTLIPSTGPGSVTAPDGDPMLVTAGKEGRIYLIDADNLGGYNTQYITDGNETTNNDPAPYDRVLGEYYYFEAQPGNSATKANNQTDKGYDIPSYFDGNFYIGLGAGSPGTVQSPELGFNVNNFEFSSTPHTGTQPVPDFVTPNKFGGRGTTAMISANGLTNGIIWNILTTQTTTDALMAYDTSGNVLFNSNWSLPGAGSNTSDTLTNGNATATAVKFGLPTVFNGMVYIGTGGNAGTGGHIQGTIVGYGLLNAPGAPNQPSQPDLTGASDTGTSNHDDITSDSTPTFVGYAEPNSIVSLLIDGQSLGTTTASDGGIYVVTSSVIPDGTHSVVVIATDINGASTTSVAGTITITTAPPALAAATFNYAGPRQSVQSQFTQDVTASLQISDLSLMNTSNGDSVVPASDMQLQVDPSTDTATWTFPGYTDGALPDGSYLATIAAADVSDLAGNHPAHDITFSFSFMSGDANHDSIVNASDFAILAANFGKTSATYAQGDFNYDGQVNSEDFDMLAMHFDQAAPPTPLGVLVASSPSAPSAAQPAASLFNDASPIRDESSLDAPGDSLI